MRTGNRRSMGKLHTLRRAIERDPDKWRGASGARLRLLKSVKDGRISYEPSPYYSEKSYGGFIRSVLKSIDREAMTGHRSSR